MSIQKKPPVTELESFLATFVGSISLSHEQTEVITALLTNVPFSGSFAQIYATDLFDLLGMKTVDGMLFLSALIRSSANYARLNADENPLKAVFSIAQLWMDRLCQLTSPVKGDMLQTVRTTVFSAVASVVAAIGATEQKLCTELVNRFGPPLFWLNMPIATALFPVERSLIFVYDALLPQNAATEPLFTLFKNANSTKTLTALAAQLTLSQIDALLSSPLSTWISAMHNDLPKLAQLMYFIASKKQGPTSSPDNLIQQILDLSLSWLIELGDIRPIFFIATALTTAAHSQSISPISFALNALGRASLYYQHNTSILRQIQKLLAMPQLPASSQTQLFEGIAQAIALKTPGKTYSSIYQSTLQLFLVIMNLQNFIAATIPIAPNPINPLLTLQPFPFWTRPQYRPRPTPTPTPTPGTTSSATSAPEPMPAPSAPHIGIVDPTVPPYTPPEDHDPATPYTPPDQTPDQPPTSPEESST